ncbi:unnamed protein product [Owenia fusiformis]|uniref:Palmitoyltransferase n=1 Tax=Owenia fusiformis TaxID=6347 RepID=A0A8S4N768_OWEFU|nr:unnamed protein product [Owenia fusiformis]
MAVAPQNDETQNLMENKHKHQHAGDGCCSGGNGTTTPKMPTIFDVVKSGMLIPVQTLVETDGEEILNSRDDKGHTPAHWAALGGQLQILKFILDNKGLINEPSDNELGQRPIHWACVNGHVSIVDLLLQKGVSIDEVDTKGCTPLIVASQYGKTVLAGYLMGKGARLQITDKDGDNALHWAAFKGQTELMRLLIYSGFNPKQPDNFQQTPLHLACINGNLAGVKELCENDGVEIELPDKNGKTPIMLAMGRKHEDIVIYLKKKAQNKNRLIPKIDFWALLFGPPGNSKGALLFFLVNILFWGYPMYIIKAIPYTWYDLQILHVIFIVLNVIMWISLYHCNTIDPGYLPRNIPEYDLAIKQVAHFDEWKQGRNPLSRLCHTCRTVKTIRSKHCKICNRCIKQMDHHCPYIYNCVGYNNRGSFAIFCCSCLLNGLISWFIGGVCWSMEGFPFNVDYVVGVLMHGLFFEGVAIVLAGSTLFHAAFNLTTNERINKKRYDYLKDGKGNYYNPFNRGFKSNMLEFFHIKRGLTEDEVEYLNVQCV